jgi:hypothetical protein
VYETHSWNGRKNLKYSIRGYAFANGFIILAEELNIFRLGRICTGGLEDVVDLKSV